MLENYDEFTSRDTVVVAVAQEDSDLKKHGQMIRKLPSVPPYDIVADIGCEQTSRYHRTHAYLIDKQGIVRQVFPMLIHHRGSWDAVLREIDRL